MEQQMVDSRILDDTLKTTLRSIDLGKQQVFEIAESARREYAAMESDVVAINAQVYETIQEVDRLEAAYRRSRQQLVLVSRNFTEYSEEQIKKIYDEAHGFQTQVLVVREREAQLRIRRDDLARRLKNVYETIHKAETVVTQLGVVFHYLSGDLNGLGNALKSAEQRQYLGIRVIQAQEEERRRLAREIHDGPAQMMANVVIRAEICERVLDRDVDRVREELRELKQMVRDSLAEVRQIIFDLRPMELDDLGLIPTLRRYMGKIAENTHIELDLIVLGKEVRLENTLEVALFRSVQEALSNIVKHSRAKSAIVKVEVTKTEVAVHVKDDGRGFDPTQVQARGKDHFGLLGIRERVQLLDGKVDIRSEKGKGTRINISLPLLTQGGTFDESSA